MNALSNLWNKLTRSKKYREAFVASQLKRGIPTQIRILRKQRNWKQEDLAEASGLTQGAISRAEDPDYGNLTFNNVLKIAAGFDVAFIGKFIPFSEFARWHDNLSEETLGVQSFKEDQVEAQSSAPAPESLPFFASTSAQEAMVISFTVEPSVFRSLTTETQVAAEEIQQLVVGGPHLIPLETMGRQEDVSSKADFLEKGETNKSMSIANGATEKGELSLQEAA